MESAVELALLFFFIRINFIRSNKAIEYDEGNVSSIFKLEDNFLKLISMLKVLK